jgi:hypothetical protein
MAAPEELSADMLYKVTLPPEIFVVERRSVDLDGLDRGGTCCGRSGWRLSSSDPDADQDRQVWSPRSFDGAGSAAA